MTKKLLLAFVFLFALQAAAQDHKWSVEANYALNLDEFPILENGTYDIGLKYRFVNTPLVHLGLELNGGINFDESNEPGSVLDIRSTRYLFQPKVFAEFDLPFVSRLHPSASLGYSILSFDSSGTINGVAISDGGADGGFGFDFGLSYDITNRFFVQVKYDYINLNVKDSGVLNGAVFNVDYHRSINRIKFGVGFRF